MWGRVFVLFRKELRQVWREPRARVLLVGPPLLQLIIFGYAVNLDVQDARVGWLDRDRTAASRELRAAFEGSPYLRIVREIQRDEEAETLLDQGRVEAVVQISPGFETDLKRGRQAAVQVLLDGTNSNTAAIVGAYFAEVISRYSTDRLRARLREQGLTAQPEGVVLRSRVWFNENLASRDYFVPGVVVNIIGLVTVMLTAMAIVREKELGTMEQLMVSPLRPVEIMLGKTLPFALIGIGEVALVTSAALMVFGIPFRGKPWFLLICAVLFLLTTLGAGLLISTLSGTQQQAMMGSFFFFLPTFMLSGFAFPIRNMPEVVQWLTLVNPVRYFIEIVRGIFLKGIGPEVLWPQMLAMTLFGVGMLTFSSLRFHKRLD
jgi:ABC-2 type transport system permease protein